MRDNKTNLLAPQASASTNSATRAVTAFLDGVSQEISAESSAKGADDNIPTEEIRSEIRTTATGRRIEVYAERPSEAPPRRRRGRCEWYRCDNCSFWFAADADVRGARRFCTLNCCNHHAVASGKYRGVNNPRWLGGVSKDNMRYRRRQKERHPLQEAARRAVQCAVRSGRLIKRPCEKCGATPAHGHHDDYSKPLDVRWLCRPCHTAHHTAERRATPRPTMARTRSERRKVRGQPAWKAAFLEAIKSRA